MLEIAPETLAWLLDSDPAIRWQVQHDLLGADEAIWRAERDRVAQEGWGAAVLAAQDAEKGTWGGGLYTPKWTSTTYSLYVLRCLGIPPGHPQALAGCQALLAGGLFLGREFRFSRRQARRDLGASALAVALCRYHGAEHPALGAMEAFLLARQRPDGAWVPDDDPDSEAYAAETTRLVLDALAQGPSQKPGAPGGALTAEAIARGWAYLTSRIQALGQGATARSGWKVFSYPPYWFFDLLTALDDRRAAGLRRDNGLATAIELVRARRGRDGRWPAGRPRAGKTHVVLEPGGGPGRWTTLRALRVLKWWEEA